MNRRNSKQFTYDVSENELFKKDAMNFINALGIDQLETIGNVYLLDIFLNKDNCVELHYHPNASELTYVISGEVEFGFMDPDTSEWRTFTIGRGEVISIPRGWWHYACAKKNQTHLLAIHDTNNLETIFGSDLLRLTPDELLAHIYCLDKEAVEKTISPIDETVIIGPPVHCNGQQVRRTEEVTPILKEDNVKEPRIKREVKTDTVKKMEKEIKKPPKMKPFFEMDEYQLDPFYAEHYYKHPIMICPHCFSYH